MFGDEEDLFIVVTSVKFSKKFITSQVNSFLGFLSKYISVRWFLNEQSVLCLRPSIYISIYYFSTFLLAFFSYDVWQESEWVSCLFWFLIKIFFSRYLRKQSVISSWIPKQYRRKMKTRKNRFIQLGPQFCVAFASDFSKFYGSLAAILGKKVKYSYESWMKFGLWSSLFFFGPFYFYQIWKAELPSVRLPCGWGGSVFFLVTWTICSAEKLSRARENSLYGVCQNAIWMLIFKVPRVFWNSSSFLQSFFPFNFYKKKKKTVIRTFPLSHSPAISDRLLFGAFLELD